jgi:hypothetical protein
VGLVSRFNSVRSIQCRHIEPSYRRWNWRVLAEY